MMRDEIKERKMGRVIDADYLIAELEKLIKTDRSTIEIKNKLIPMIKKSETVDSSVYNNHPIYESEPLDDGALFDYLCEHDRAALIAWFRCNSCYSCAFRDRVLPKINRSIDWCSRTHEHYHIIDMMETLGYSKE